MIISLNQSFQAEVHADLTAVANDVLQVVQQRLPGNPPAGIKPIICKAGHSPLTQTFPECYLITLTTTGRYYAQFAYQLGHELGHVMLGSRRSNGLIETLATAISHQVLDDLTEKWRVSPPYQHWINYAPAFSNYRENTEKNHLSNFPAEVQVMVNNCEWHKLSRYLGERRNDQDSNMVDRDLNCLGAIAIRSDTVPWPSLVGVAWKTKPSPYEDPDYRDDLQLELSQFPVELLPLLKRLGRL